jgi:hypothetical protein
LQHESQGGIYCGSDKNLPLIGSGNKGAENEKLARILRPLVCFAKVRGEVARAAAMAAKSIIGGAAGVRAAMWERESSTLATTFCLPGKWRMEMIRYVRELSLLAGGPGHQFAMHGGGEGLMFSMELK